MERTIIYILGPKRLQDDYQKGKQLPNEFTGWLKIGQTSTKENEDIDKWKAVLRRVNQEPRTGIPEPSIILDVFEYPKMRTNLDDRIRRELTNEIFGIDSSEQYNLHVKNRNFEIKAGREFVYGASRNQVLYAIAKFERDLLLQQKNKDQIDILVNLIKKNCADIYEDDLIQESAMNAQQLDGFKFYDKIVNNLSGCSIIGNHTDGRNYATFNSNINILKNCGYSIKYSLRRNTAIIDFETYDGENGRNIIEEKLSQISNRPIEIDGPNVGSKNGNKFFWRASKSFEGFEENVVVEWFLENVRIMNDFFENIMK